MAERCGYKTAGEACRECASAGRWYVCCLLFGGGSDCFCSLGPDDSMPPPSSFSRHQHPSPFNVFGFESFPRKYTSGTFDKDSTKLLGSDDVISSICGAIGAPAVVVGYVSNGTSYELAARKIGGALWDGGGGVVGMGGVESARANERWSVQAFKPSIPRALGKSK